MKNLFFGISIIGILMISGSVAYYFVFFLPQQQTTSNQDYSEASYSTDSIRPVPQDQPKYEAPPGVNATLDCLAKQEACLMDMCGVNDKNDRGLSNYERLKQEQEQSKCMIENALSGACVVPGCKI